MFIPSASEAIHSRYPRIRSLDCFVAFAPLRKRLAFVAGNDAVVGPSYPAQRGIQYAAACRFYGQRLWNTAVKPGDDGWIQFRIPATLSRPGRASAMAPRKQRAQGMPGASRTHSLACEIKKHTSIVTAGPAGFTRHSLRGGLRLISRSPR